MNVGRGLFLFTYALSILEIAKYSAAHWIVSAAAANWLDPTPLYSHINLTKI